MTTEHGDSGFGGDRPAPRPPTADLARLHAIVAAVALGLQPLSAAMASIGQVGLLVMWIVRWIADPSARIDPRAALCRPIVACGLAMVVWTMVAAIWSPDPAEGLGGMRPVRTMVFAVTLFPALRSSWLPLVGMLIGVGVASIVQVAMYTGLVPDPIYEPWDVTGGLSKHPGNAAVWSGCAAMLAAGRLATVGSTPNPRGRWWLGVAAVLGVISVVIAGNRSLYFGLPVAIVLLGVVLLVIGSTRVRRTVMVAAVVAFVGLVALPLIAPNSGPVVRLLSLGREVGDGVRASTAAEIDSSGGLRTLWWREAVPIVKEAPILGHGSGATRQVYADRLATLDQATVPERAYTDNPHSSIVFEFVEHGAVGMLLLVGFGIALFATAWRAAIRDPRWVGLPAAVTLLAVYGIGNTVQLSPYPLMLLATLAACAATVPPRIAVTTAP
jgi:O-antigen ligase